MSRASRRDNAGSTNWLGLVSNRNVAEHQQDYGIMGYIKLSMFFPWYLCMWGSWIHQLQGCFPWCIFSWSGKYTMPGLPSGFSSPRPWKSPMLSGNYSSNPDEWQGQTVNLLDGNVWANNWSLYDLKLNEKPRRVTHTDRLYRPHCDETGMISGGTQTFSNFAV